MRDRIFKALPAVVGIFIVLSSLLLAFGIVKPSPLVSMLLLLIVARLLGELMKRMHQPTIVGEILAGVILGPAVLGRIDATAHLEGIAELSVFLIVLAAGLEMEFRDVLNSVKGRGFFVAFLDFIVPLGSGLLVGIVFGLGVMQTIFVGLCMSITALPVVVRILDKFGLLQSQIARYSIATAILNDMAALLCLGVILHMGKTQSEMMGFASVGWVILKTAIQLTFFALIVYAASRLLRWGGSQTRFFERWLGRIIELFGKEALFGVAVIFVLAFGAMSESLGSHYIIGAFFGALLLSRDVFGTSQFAELQNTINTITEGFLAPIFFAVLGLHFSLMAFTSPALTLAVLAVAMGSKILGGWAGARFLNMGEYESLGVGLILNARGVMELVVANIALQQNFIDEALFSVLVLMGVVTTVVSPLLFRKYVSPNLNPLPIQGPGVTQR